MASSFNRNHTSVCKGMAILLMVYHHLFIEPNRLHNNYISVLSFGTLSIEHSIAVFGKICVAMFLFLSGYGLFCLLENGCSLVSMYKKALKKLIHFFINFWVVVFLIFPIGCLTGFFPFKLSTLLQLMTGYYPRVMEWWFVCQYVVFLVLSPLFVSIFKQDTTNRIQSLIILLMIYGFSFLGNRYMYGNHVLVFLFKYLNYINNKACLLAFIAGILAARFDLFRYFLFSDKRIQLFTNTGILAAVVAIRVILVKDASMIIDFLAAPFFVFSFAAIVDQLKAVQTLFRFFAYHSTNIWLIHTFWCYYFAQPLVLLPRYSTLIFLWLLLLSVGSSFVIQALFRNIEQHLLPLKM